MKVELKSQEELPAFVKSFLEKYPQGAIVALQGQLGAGKTTFVRTLIGELAKRQGEGEPRVPSPTFVLHQQYETQPRVEHFDLYRLDNCDTNALVEVGYFEAMERVEREGGFLFVEWPERAQKKALKCNVWVTITLQGETRFFELS